MRIAILLGSPAISGGSYVIYEHAVRMTRRGHQVAIVTECPVKPEEYSWHTSAGEPAWMTFDSAQEINFDIAIATWWRTVLDLWRIRATSYAYFIQSVESKFFIWGNTASPDARACSRLAEATYLFPILMITEATWIRDYLKSRHGREAELVRNGIRKDIYREDGERYAERRHGRLRVLVEGPVDVAFKNVPRAIELCRRSRADEVWLLTLSRISSFPGADRVFSNVPIHETPKIYRSCDVLVKLSYIEGMFSPPLEMFHCGGTAVVYDVTGHDEYIRHGENAFVARTDDEEAVVGWLNRLKDSPALLERLKEGARRTARDWYDWEGASNYFEKSLTRCCGLVSGPRELLSSFSAQLFEYYASDIIRFEREQHIRDGGSDMRATIDELRHVINLKNDEINSIYFSKGWKLATALKEARHSFSAFVKLPLTIIRGIF